MAKAKPNQKIHIDKLQTALDKLEQLEDKPKDELTLRESIYFLRDKLNSALKKGYNYQDLSEILAQQNILISAATLKQYLTDIGKKSSNRKRSRSSKDKSSTNVNSFKEAGNSSLSQDEINRIEEIESTKKSQTTAARDRSKSKKATKPKVLSGFDDDLSSEFNQY